MRRRLAVGCAMIATPSVVVLDEPTTGLDPVSRRGIWQTIAEALDVADPKPMLASGSSTLGPEQCGSAPSSSVPMIREPAVSSAAGRRCATAVLASCAVGAVLAPEGASSASFVQLPVTAGRPVPLHPLHQSIKHASSGHARGSAAWLFFLHR
eukprot:s4121_g4.t1